MLFPLVALLLLLSLGNYLSEVSFKYLRSIGAYGALSGKCGCFAHFLWLSMSTCRIRSSSSSAVFSCPFPGKLFFGVRKDNQLCSHLAYIQSHLFSFSGTGVDIPTPGVTLRVCESSFLLAVLILVVVVWLMRTQYASQGKWPSRDVPYLGWCQCLSSYKHIEYSS